MLTACQIRAARALLRWSAAEAAEKGETTRKTIERLEHYEGVPPSRTQTLVKLQNAFEAAGVEFIGTPDDGPGVRLRRSVSSKADE